MSKHAKLRCCARCQWIYTGDTDCPKCDFASYGARYVFGDACYRYALTQKPWLEQKVSTFIVELYKEIADTNPNKPKPRRFKIVKLSTYPFSKREEIQNETEDSNRRNYSRHTGA